MIILERSFCMMIIKKSPISAAVSDGLVSASGSASKIGKNGINYS